MAAAFSIVRSGVTAPISSDYSDCNPSMPNCKANRVRTDSTLSACQWTSEDAAKVYHHSRSVLDAEGALATVAGA